MKITILSTFDTFGGASISGLRLHQALLKNDLDSNLLVQTQKSKYQKIQTIAPNWILQKISFLRFALDRLLFYFREKSKKVRFAFSTAAIGTDVSTNPMVSQADIIHLFWINFGYLSLKSIQKIGQNNKPIIWNLQDMWPFTGGCHYSGTCENYKKQCGNCEQFLARPHHNDLSNQTWKRKEAAFQNLNLTIVSSSQWLADLASQSLLFKNYKILTIPTPIDTQVFTPSIKSEALIHFDLNPVKKYILFAAVKISDERKGFAYFKEAIEKLSKIEAVKNNTEILIFGQAQQSDFEDIPLKVNILGKLSNLETISLAYSAASVFVIPSLEDNLPNTIIESLACGTPVVGFEAGGIPEMIDHKQNGYLAQYKSAEDLANGIYWTLFESNYNELKLNARQKAIENYSETVVAEQYKKLYQSLL